ncbi:MAG: VOC family protein [Ignavibacteria bacterium]|nr:VOC family protein [Ignavibacteria bacterium]
MKQSGIIHHIEIYVSDLKKSISFWKWLLTKKFSYEIFEKWDRGISFIFGKTYIVLVQTEKKYLDVPYNRKRTGLNHIAFHCTSRKFIDKLTEELKKKKIRILYTDKHPYAGGKNYYAVFFEDPDRIKVEVVLSE